MKDWRISKETVNKRIIEVCKNQYKKDAKDAHEIVELAGYKIEKYEGRYIVLNPKTGKRVSLLGYSAKTENRRKPCVAYDTGKGIKVFNWNEEPKFDFVAYLDKPWNREYYRNIPESEYKRARANIKSQKNWIEYRKKEVEKTRKDIEDKIANLEHVNRELQKAKDELENIRKKYGLKERK